MGWLAVLAGLSWATLHYVVDRASVPAYRQARTWRLVSVMLLGLLLWVTVKALLWHQELVLQIRLCP